MSFDKAIAHKKEHRKPYHDSRNIDMSCRNHGSCDYCRTNRLYQSIKENEKLKIDLKEFLSN